MAYNNYVLRGFKRREFHMFRKVLIAGFVAFFAMGSAFAQPIDEMRSEENRSPQRPSQSQIQQSMTDTFGSGPPIDVIEMKIVKDDYIDPNMENMSKLMWALGVPDMSDNTAIDNYLKINECELYMRFFNNDFEWEKIRNATRSYIHQNVGSFPTKFEIMIPIYLDRYNAEKGYFDLTEESKMINLRRLDINMNTRTNICRDKGAIRGYSRNMILNLNRPFSLTRIPVSRPLAELYLEEARVTFENIPLKLRMAYYERLAYLRVKVRLTSFKEFVLGRHGEQQAVVFGQLDGIEIYADVERQKLMYKEDKQQVSARQRRFEARQGQIRAETFGAETEDEQVAAEPEENQGPRRLPRTPYSRSTFDRNDD